MGFFKTRIALFSKPEEVQTPGQVPEQPADAPTLVPAVVPDTVVVRKKPILDYDPAHMATVHKVLLITEDSPLKRIADHPINVMTLDTERRKLLLQGPKMDIKTKGGIMIRKDVPLRALMVSCQDVHSVIFTRPSATDIRVASVVDSRAMEDLLDIFTTKALLGLKEINLVSNDFTADVLTYQACLALGIYYAHINPLLSALRATISSRTLSKDELNAVATRIPSSNPLLKHLANDLCHKRFKQEIPDIVDFEHWLSRDGKDGLKKEMAAIDQAHMQRREAFILREIDWRKDKELAEWGPDEGEK